VTRRSRALVWALSLAVGTVGGLYGIGGGSLLAPILLAAGLSAYDVAPATLPATFLTSIAGIVTYQILQATHGGTIAPDWALGAFLGGRPADAASGQWSTRRRASPDRARSVPGERPGRSLLVTSYGAV
jgi:uncharacterized membrane protein YfcA